MIRIPKNKPPSRIRYEKKHPTVSFRLNKDLKTRLKKELEKESFADFIKEALGKREREKKSLEKARDLAYNEGVVDGYDKAKNQFLVQAPCAICGEPMIVDRDGDKAELARLMRANDWCHLKCKGVQNRYRK